MTRERRPRRYLEKAVQRRVKAILAAGRCATYDLSQPRRTMQTAGLPDLICFHPDGALFFVEIKAETGRLSPAQKAFQDLAARAGIPYIVGGAKEVAEHLGMTWNG